MRRRRSLCIKHANESELPKKIPEVSKIEKKVISHPDFTTPVQAINSSSAEAINRKTMIKDIPFYPDPIYRPLPKPIKIPRSEGLENIDISPEINIDLEENSPFQEGVILETYHRPNKSFLQEPFFTKTNCY